MPLSTPSVTRRMACWVYEGMLLFGLVFVSGYLFSTLSQTRHALDHRHGLQFFVFVVLAIYFVWFWSTGKGQTLAMKTWRLRVLDLHGRPLTQRRALLRYILSWLWFLPPLGASALLALPGPHTLVLTAAWLALWANACQLHPQKQFWHDAWAGTQLVDATSPSK